MPATYGSVAGTMLEIARTDELGAATLRAARALLDEVFYPEMTDDDWDHTLGGQHALLWEPGRLVAHAAVIERRLTADGRPLRAGYVEGVAVSADRRRRGYGTAVMTAIEDEISRRYDVGALGSSEPGVPFYRARGWRVWQGKHWVCTPNGLVRTPDEEGWIYLLDKGSALARSGDLICEWRPGDVW